MDLVGWKSWSSFVFPGCFSWTRHSAAFFCRLMSFACTVKLFASIQGIATIQCPANVVMPVFWIGGGDCSGIVGQRLIAKACQRIGSKMRCCICMRKQRKKYILDFHQFPAISFLIVAGCLDLASSRHLLLFAMLSQLSSQWCLRKLVISKLKNMEAEAKLSGPENNVMYRPRMPQTHLKSDIIRQQRQRMQR